MIMGTVGMYMIIINGYKMGLIIEMYSSDYG
jgi:hypothetical protein